MTRMTPARRAHIARMVQFLAASVQLKAKGTDAPEPLRVTRILHNSDDWREI